MYYYTDNETADFLAGEFEKVYLLGSYDDPNNFGDIIQLKGALEFHRNLGDREPVIMLSYRAYKEDGYVEKLKKWFNCKYFIFQSHTNEPEQQWATLSPIASFPAGGLLHVYGGGYLNKMWGEWRIQEIEYILDLFKVKDYFLSGHQIDKDTVPKLQKLFEKKAPLLVGLRDRESLSYLQTMSIDVSAHYSFDDVTNIFLKWIAASRQDIKSFVSSGLSRKKFAIHMNMASYTGDEQHRNDIVESIREATAHYPALSPQVLHSYNERRPEFTKDSLGTIIELQEDFPFHAYSVINLAQMALDINPSTNYYPQIRGILSTVEFAITCSYHTSMLMSFLDKPTYLIASNEYYRQKRAGLGYHDNLEEYLKNPASYIKNFASDVAAHHDWLRLVERAIA